MRLFNLAAVVLQALSIPVEATPFHNEVEKRTPTCGLRGYDRRPNLISQRQCSLYKCAADCANTTECKAYGYGNGYCRFYSASCLSFIQRDPSAPFKFYDKACPVPASITTRAITTTSKGVTTSTTKQYSTTTKRSTASAKQSTTTAKRVTTTTRKADVSTTTSTVARTSSSPSSAATRGQTALTSSSSAATSTESSTIRTTITTSVQTTADSLSTATSTSASITSSSTISLASTTASTTQTSSETPITTTTTATSSPLTTTSSAEQVFSTTSAESTSSTAESLTTTTQGPSSSSSPTSTITISAESTSTTVESSSATRQESSSSTSSATTTSAESPSTTSSSTTTQEISSSSSSTTTSKESTSTTAQSSATTVQTTSSITSDATTTTQDTSSSSSSSSYTTTTSDASTSTSPSQTTPTSSTTEMTTTLSTTAAPQSSSTTSTTTSSTTTVTELPGPTCLPEDEGNVYLAPDGSLFQLFCSSDFGGTDIIGMNPINGLESFARTVELCVSQGTACSGSTYRKFSSQPAPQGYLKRAVTGVRFASGYMVNAALRLTGPAGATAPLLTNGDFDSSSFAPWTSTTSMRSTSFDVVNGVAVGKLLLSQTPVRAQDSMTFQQPIPNLPAGSSIHLEFDWTIQMQGQRGLGPMDMTYCTVTAKAGTTTLWTSSLPGVATVYAPPQAHVSVTSVLDADANSVSITYACQGQYDSEMTIDNIEASTFDMAVGANPIIPQPRQVLLNPSFVENGKISPWQFGGTENRRYTMTPRPGSVTIDIRSGGTDAITGIVQSFQTDNYLDQGQTYRFSADITYNIPNSAASCSGYVQIPGARVTIWQVSNVQSTQTFNLDMRKVAPERVTSISWGFQCTDPRQQISVTLANVSLVANPPP